MLEKHLKTSFLWKASLLALAFLFRLAFGFFAMEDYEDHRQIYLIGLKYYCTGLWPYFGADVIPGVQIPGSLQGLIVGLPLHAWPIPEAPFVFLNLLSLVALCLFAWYCSRRLPSFPRWIIWGWLFTAPWTLNISTNIYNVSYVLFGSVIFFIGFFETIPALTMSIVRPWLANLMMGFALLWNAQFHMSYVTLGAFVAVSAYYQLKQSLAHAPSDLFVRLGFFLMGAATTGAFLIPTYLNYGFGGLGGTETVIRFNASNLTYFFNILAQLFSLASAEVPRFLGGGTEERMKFFYSHVWATPFTLVALVLGLLQPIVMLLSGIRKAHPQKEWPAVKILAFSTFLLVYIGFAFAVKWPTSFHYYLMLPVVMLYAFYVFSPWTSRRWFPWVVGVLFVCNLGFNLGLAAFKSKEKSFFVYRESILKAIEAKDYRLMGERRPGSRY